MTRDVKLEVRLKGHPPGWPFSLGSRQTGVLRNSRRKFQGHNINWQIAIKFSGSDETGRLPRLPCRRDRATMNLCWSLTVFRNVS